MPKNPWFTDFLIELALERRYGKIGISAVAAALPYQSDAKNLAYAPVTPRENQRLTEAA